MADGILSVLDPEDQRRIRALLVRRSFARNEVIFHEGDPGDSLHLVERGQVAVRVHTRMGDTATLRVIPAGGVVGELALVRPRPRTATAVALTRTETLVLRQREFDDLRTRHPAVERFLVELLAERVSRLNGDLADAYFERAEVRVRRKLHEVAIQAGEGAELPLRQEDLATMAGTTRSTANRSLRELERAEVISLARGSIVVRSLTALETHCR